MSRCVVAVRCDQAYTELHEVLGETCRVFSDCLVAIDWLPGIGDVMPGNVCNGLASAGARLPCLVPDGLRA